MGEWCLTMISTKNQVTLVTGRTINQGVAKEFGKFSSNYLKIASMCHVDPSDLVKFKIIENSNVLVSTVHGSIVVKAKKIG